MSELNIVTLSRAFYDRLYGSFLPKLEIHPDSEKRLGMLAKEFLQSDDTPSGEIFVFKGVAVTRNPEVPVGRLRVDREWTDEDVDSWVLYHDDPKFLKWKLPPTDFDLPEAE